MNGTRFDKPLTDTEGYAAAANWCNGNGARMVDQGGFYEVVTQPAPTPSDKRADLKAAVTAKRWEVEAAGITVAGMTIRTGKDDQARIISVIATADLAGVTAVRFKGADDTFVELSIAQVKGIAAAVGLHVQACFDAEAAHYEDIDALPIEALATYDISTRWPGGPV